MFNFLSQMFGDNELHSTSIQSINKQELMENVRSQLLRLGGLNCVAGTIIESVPDVTIMFQQLADSTVATVFDATTKQPIGSITTDGQIVYLHQQL